MIFLEWCKLDRNAHFYSMEMPLWLKQADEALMRLVNGQWAAPWLESWLPWMRNQVTWYPFYLFLAVFAVLNFGRRGWYWILGFISSVALADIVSSRLIKYTVQRLRPCTDPDTLNWVVLRIPHCSGGYSFTSSHAANHFAMAAFIFFTLRPVVGNKLGWIFGWAGLVAYAQVYVGVHYPLDVIGGALVGMAAGALVANRFNHVGGGWGAAAGQRF